MSAGSIRVSRAAGTAVEIGGTTVASIALAAEIMRRMGMRSAIAVRDGYPIYRVKKMLEREGITVYGSTRIERTRDSLKVFDFGAPRKVRPDRSLMLAVRPKIHLFDSGSGLRRSAQ